MNGDIVTVVVMRYGKMIRGIGEIEISEHGTYIKPIRLDVEDETVRELLKIFDLIMIDPSDIVQIWGIGE